MDARVALLLCLLFCLLFSWLNARHFSQDSTENMPRAQLKRFTLLKDVAISPAYYAQYARASFTLKPIEVTVRPRGFPDFDTKGLWRDAVGNWYIIKAPYPIDFRALVPEPGAVLISRNTTNNTSKPSMTALKNLQIGTINELAQYMDAIDYFL